MKVTIEVKAELFRFTSKSEWVNKAKGWFKAAGVGSDFLCVDALGRICTCGREFIRAEKEGTYPIVVYSVILS